MQQFFQTTMIVTLQMISYGFRKMAHPSLCALSSRFPKQLLSRKVDSRWSRNLLTLPNINIGIWSFTMFCFDNHAIVILEVPYVTKQHLVGLISILFVIYHSEIVFKLFWSMTSSVELTRLNIVKPFSYTNYHHCSSENKSLTYMLNRSVSRLNHWQWLEKENT